MRSDFEAAPFLTLAAAFTLGALATWVIATALERKHAAGPVADDILAQRVRARLAEVASRPAAISVEVEQGVVRISGDAPQEEHQALLASLLEVPGVWRVRNALGTSLQRSL